jgi:hypothetical protein
VLKVGSVSPCPVCLHIVVVSVGSGLNYLHRGSGGQHVKQTSLPLLIEICQLF